MALENAALRRMIRPAQKAADLSSIGVARAWRVSLPRAAHDGIGLVAGVASFETARGDVDAALAEWDAFALALAFGDGDAEGPSGLVQLDAGLLSALIEVQTMGYLPAAAAPARPATATDAALAGHVIDRWLADAAAAGAGGQGWRTGRHLAERRAARLLLDEGTYALTRITLSLGERGRTGILRLVRPEAVTPPQGPGARPGRTAVLGAPAELVAVLHRTEVTLDWLKTLAVGDVLEFPRAALDRVRVETVDGVAVARAQLGRQGERMAIRLGTGPRQAAEAPELEDLSMAAPSVEPLAGLPDLPDPAGGPGGAAADGYAAASGLVALEATEAEADMAPAEAEDALPAVEGLPPLDGLPGITD